MKTSIENGVLTIVVPLDSTPRVSTTGKSLLLVNTQGFMKTGLVHGGKPVSVSLNVIVPIK